MLAKLSSAVGIAAGWASTLKLCCVLPGLLSLVGVAGSTAMLVLRWVTPALAALSAGSLAYSFWHLYGRRRGTRAGRGVTWVAAFMTMGFWIYRFLSA